MAGRRVEFITPVCLMKGLEQQYQKIERGSWKVPEVPLEPTMTYFNNKPTYKWKAEYDHFFAFTNMYPLWDKRKAKDNGVYLPDIFTNIFEQEKDKPIPVLTSMDYGRPCRPFYDFQENYRRAHATSDFYRPQGVF